MATSNTIQCPFCGVSNPEDLSDQRCRACGAKISDSVAPSQRSDRLGQQLQQDGFSPLWCGVSLAVIGILTAAILIGLPMVVPAFDFEGSAGMLLAIPVWFLAGMLVGLISPERTVAEPVVAAILVALPTALHLFTGQTVKTMPAFMYLIMSALGVLFAMIGSYFGERIQVGPAAHQTPD